jgi:hypothetical protein
MNAFEVIGRGAVGLVGLIGVDAPILNLLYLPPPLHFFHE